ncbi:hypothetical protein [Allopontixanthobacter sediminis]|uniref:Uncharacterized protein n=1 Tax=Allopontixanthobacter sediminis TaxID=1689985 RepID=A0A845AZV6_9SPHN|nr:hypothetical protein [Allopontixanthobacter sediminis]MXP42962.1 hypothetical protein [Allopontixanthobacter sediminis]
MSTAKVLSAKRTTALIATLSGKKSADPESLSRSYALPVADVRRIMKNMEVEAL